MNIDYSNITIHGFLDVLSAENPIPAAGSTAGVVGSTAAALVVMAASFALGKDRFADVQEEVERIHRRAQALRESLLELASADAEAYSRVIAARKLPKSNPEEDRVRCAKLDEALCGATDTLLAIARASKETGLLARRITEIGSPFLRADALSAAEFADAALRACIVQARQNLKRIRDEGYIESAETSVRELT